MNNKGFAITGIIYTLFILFLTILLAILSGFSIYQRLITKSIESLENDLTGKLINNGTEINQINDSGKTSYYGKYVFELNLTNKSNTECSAYLNKNINFKDNITFTTKDCNDYYPKLTWLDSTETTCNNPVGCLKLTKIYNFEEES